MNQIKEITGLNTIDELLSELKSLKEEYNLGPEMIEDLRQSLDYLLGIRYSTLNTVRKDIRVYDSRKIKRC